MLLQLRDYIKKAQVVNIQQLTREFRVDQTALLPMLDVWVKKGVISPCQERAACGGGCSSCPAGAPILYQWNFCGE